MKSSGRWLAGIAVLALVAASCSSDDTGDTATTAASADAATTTLATTTTEAVAHEDGDDHDEGPLRSVDAPVATITVDGDVSDWGEVAALSLTLEPIIAEAGEPIEPRDSTVRLAHDDKNIYMLFTVDDDYNWNPDDAHLSAAVAVMFPVTDGGPHMGADDEEGEVSTGMVDIWHWELECAAGVASGGGAGHPAGDGKDAGNDSVCNFDDEWATDAETREDDNSATGENTLLGVWTHSNPVEDGAGVWNFEMSRPLQTGDEQDGQFVAGETTLLALAYWDPDFGPDGWEDDTHVQSSNQEWIEVNLK